MGVTRSGNFAVLTNYKEEEMVDVQGQRSRGGMVTAWLTADPAESTQEFVHRLLSGEGVRGVGGFSLLCGKLRRKIDNTDEPSLEPLAIISNRAGSTDDVPWVGGDRGKVYGLSNTSYDNPVAWPKTRLGKQLLEAAIEKSISLDTPDSREDLIERLFEVLNEDTLPAQKDDETFEKYTYQLRHSIFIPAFGRPDPVHASADKIAAANPEHVLQGEEVDESPHKYSMTGVYGTQRQTIMLVDWDGNVTWKERALWDAEGNAIPRGKGDMEFNFQVENWETFGRHNGQSSQL